MIYAGIDGIKNKTALPFVADFDIYTATEKQLKRFQMLPNSLEQAKTIAAQSAFIKSIFPKKLLDSYC